MRRIFRTRFGLLYFLSAVFAVLAFGMRSALLIRTVGQADLGILEVARIYSVGLIYDLAAVSYYLLAFLPFVVLPSDRMFRHWAYRAFLATGLFGAVFLMLFSTVGEWLFWDEFGIRFNFIAVDYLVYTNEVVHNILESYPVPALVSGMLLVDALLLGFALRRTGLLSAAPEGRSTLVGRLSTGLVYVLLPIFFFNVLDQQKLADAVENRFNRELSKNGTYSIVSAFRNNTLPYEEFYPVEDRDKVFAHMGKILAQGNERFETDDPTHMMRWIDNGGPELRPNVVLVMEESLSAEYMGVFGDTRGLTPRLDAVAGRAMVFDNLYATGTRTVRGMEAVVLSVPPTPGRSIVKRPDNHDMFSAGFIFQQHGYDTQFLYGGHGYFDNMNDFFGHNGFRIIDRTDLSADEITFANVWGVCDEDLFDRTLREADASYRRHQPFFQFVMTTSNHRPYTYPEGRVDIPSHTGQYGAVKYADYAVGQFLEEAATRPWFDNTIFVIVADHNASRAARVDLPAWRYKVPLLVYAPQLVEPTVISKLSSQVDVIPTLLEMLHWSYESKFYGQSILDDDFRQRAFLGTYRKLGLLQPGRIAILSPDRSTRQYRIEFQNLHGIQYAAMPVEAEDRLDTVACYQSASYLYKNGLSRWSGPVGKPGPG